MEFVAPIAERPSVAEEVADKLRQLIFSGGLAAGERINEVQVAAKLGVSRTPVREALRILEGEHALTIVPRRGAFVRALSVEEVREIYPIRSFLDPEALRLAGAPDAATLARLTSIAEDLARETDPIRAIDLDDEWYRTLWAACPNQVLKDLIEQFMRRTRRYELAAMRGEARLGRVSQHRMRMIADLKRGDLDAACEKVRASLRGGMEPVLEWLEARDAAESEKNNPKR